jgi:two-component system NtrC family response regulator
VLRIQVPALRERGVDIEVLARFFLAQFTKDTAKTLRGYTADALRRIRAHTWPGNIRELINRVRRATVMTNGPWITPQDLDLATAPTSSGPNVFQLDELLAIAEREAIRQAMVASGNNQSAAARLLNISRPKFYRLLNKHGISPVSAVLGT